MPYHTILFDLDNTILDFNRGEDAAIHQTLLHLGLPATDEVKKRYSEINLSLWKLLEQKKITRSRLLVKRFELLFEELNVQEDGQKAWHFYESQLSQAAYFMDGAKELLEQLKGKKRMFIVSNGTASVQHGRIKKAELASYFEQIFISEEVGVNKPDPAFFTYCFSHIPDFEQDKTIIVGDSLSSDIAGGIAAGLATCWFHAEPAVLPDHITPDYEITSLQDLSPILN